MSQKEETGPGLLSKVVNFVKSPTGWGDLDLQETDQETGFSKQLLKELIERKRRNDFVRKREFDMLRKMRRSEVMAGQDPAARPSFFQSSLASSPDDRATTLKKIDEIEAQMSMQWWKSKHGETGQRPAAGAAFPMSSHVPPDAMAARVGAGAARNPPSLARPGAPIPTPGAAGAPASGAARPAVQPAGAVARPLQGAAPRPAAGASGAGPAGTQRPPLAAVASPLPPTGVRPVAGAPGIPPATAAAPSAAAAGASAAKPLSSPVSAAAAPARVPPASIATAAQPSAATTPRPVVPAAAGAAAAAVPPRAAPSAAPVAPVAAAPLEFVPEPSLSGPASQPASTGFSLSKSFAIDVEEVAHDPELEEASIRFANGDDAGAEAGLMEVLAPQGARIDHDETWLTLFDLYRATGQQERFETAAIDFAARFGRSAPQWFSMPELVGQMARPSAGSADAAQADWTAPAAFGTQTLAAMNAALGRAQQPWSLNWSKLTSIAEGAVEPLTKAFAQWASQSIQLRFTGVEVLEQVLKDATPSGDREVNPAWWQLRMEALRVIHRPDEFEMVALDYCVTYEVSPPSWESAKCQYKAVNPDGSASPTIIGEAYHDSINSTLGYGYGDSQLLPQMSNVATVELAGQIAGDASEALEKLESKLLGADVMVISCARLVRIDFSAAGTVLNWVMARQAEGRQVQFVEVHRLVAAFFSVIGIKEYARVAIRRD